MDISPLLSAFILKPLAAVLAYLGIDPTHLVAGVVGAAVKSIVDKTKSRWEVLTTMFVGGMCASYLTPFAAHWLAPQTTAANNGLAFVIGTIGVSLTQYALSLSRSYATSSRLPKIIDQFNPTDPNKPNSQ